MKKALAIFVVVLGVLHLTGNVLMHINYNPETGKEFTTVGWDTNQRIILWMMTGMGLVLFVIARILWKEAVNNNSTNNGEDN